MTKKARESELWAWLSKVRELVPGCHIQRIENGLEKGTPDVEGCVSGVAFWIENKCAARPARESTPIKPRIEPEQLAFARKRRGAGGIALFLLQVGVGKRARRYLLNTATAELLALTGLTEPTLARECLNAPGSSDPRDLVAAIKAYHGYEKS